MIILSLKFPFIHCYHDHPLDRWFDTQTNGEDTTTTQQAEIPSEKLVGIEAVEDTMVEDTMVPYTGNFNDEMVDYDMEDIKRQRPWQPEPSHRTTNEDYRYGQRPRPSYTNYKDELEGVWKSKGKRWPGDFHQHGQLIATVDPQLLKEEVASWKNIALQRYNASNKTFATTDQTFRFLETTLGPAAMALWEAYKAKYPDEYQQLVDLGNNPYNFVNRVAHVLTGADPNEGLRYEQQRMVRRLEQLKLYNYDHIKPFIAMATEMVTKAGGAFDENLKQKILKKLPGPLGEKLTKEYEDFASHEKMNIYQLGQFIIHRIEEECTMIAATRQLKQSKTNFCKNIYTVQQFGDPDTCRSKKPRRKVYKTPRRGYSQPKRIHTLRKSTRRSPFLQKGHHVRKYKPARQYSRAVKCFACGEEGHVSTSCNKRYGGQRNERHDLVESLNEDLIEIASDISDTESIYSWTEEIVYEATQEDDTDSESDEDLVNHMTRHIF